MIFTIFCNPHKYDELRKIMNSLELPRYNMIPRYLRIINCFLRLGIAKKDLIYTMIYDKISYSYVIT